MTKDEALKLALEALERVNFVDADCDILSPSLADAVGEAIDVVKEALAQLSVSVEQESVAYVTDNYSRNGVNDEISAYLPVGTKIYTTPPQRKPLTDEEIDKIWVLHSIIQASDRRRQAFARAIEAAHGIKE